MSGTAPRGRGAAGEAEALATAGARRSRGCDRWVAAGIVVVVAAGAVSAWLPGSGSPGCLRPGPPQQDVRHHRGRNVGANLGWVDLMNNHLVSQPQASHCPSLHQRPQRDNPTPARGRLSDCVCEADSCGP
jgi:hypothetical protein